jgi:hypothetical protein
MYLQYLLYLQGTPPSIHLIGDRMRNFGQSRVEKISNLQGIGQYFSVHPFCSLLTLHAELYQLQFPDKG